MQEVVELAEVLRDHASQTEEDRVAALIQHRGPYFNGVDMRCGCGQPVSDYEDWARHAVRAPAS